MSKCGVAATLRDFGDVTHLNCFMFCTRKWLQKEMEILDCMSVCDYDYKGFVNNCLGKRTN